jgi:ATP-binding cassette subfamily B protein
VKLHRLLRSHLFGPYRNALWLVVGLQAVQTAASLTLPTINANLINNGVLRGDNGSMAGGSRPVWRRTM